MSDRDTIIQDELELITEFLHQRLDPARAEEVYQRLERDPEFLELATPLLFAWSVKPEWERAEDVAEAERHWEEFTRRADFTYHRKRWITRRNWMMGIVIAVIALPSFWFRGEIRDRYRDWRDYAVVQPDTAWLPIADNIRVRLEQGAMFQRGRPREDMVQTKLVTGIAHVRVDPVDTTRVGGAALPVVIETPGAEVISAYGNFTVTVHGDTTWVEEHAPVRQRFAGIVPFMPLTAAGSNQASSVVLEAGQRYRFVRGRKPELIP